MYGGEYYRDPTGARNPSFSDPFYIFYLKDQ